MREITDQLGRVISLSGPPERIVSIVPSQTELLYSLGLDKEVIGITRFCVHPRQWFRSKTRIGGTKKLDMEKIKNINPDLVIANKEENTKSQVEELAAIFPVWISNIVTLDDATAMISSLGSICNREKEAGMIVTQIEDGFLEFPVKARDKKVAYLIWKEPYMTVNDKTFIHDMIRRCGLVNVFENSTARYPETSLAEIQSLDPDYVFLSSEPYPFREKHKKEMEAAFPASRIILVDGEMFSWYGSRLIKSAGYLVNLLNTLN